MSEQISLSELKERKEKAEARANKAQDLAKELAEKIEALDSAQAKPTGSKKTKRVSHPSPTLVNPNNPSQTCKSKGRQPEWSTALKAQGSYSLSAHVRESIQHLDEENARINRAWLSRDAFKKS
jgi:DNA-binding protein H-NS